MKPIVADKLCEPGRFGQKTGAGWYRYEAGKRDAIPDPRDRGADRRLPRRQRHHAAQDQRRGDRRALHLRAGQRGRAHPRGGHRRSAPPTSTWSTSTATASRAFRGGPMLYADTVGLPNVVRALRRFAAEPGADRVLAARAAAARSSPPPARRSTEPEDSNMTTDAVIVSTARTGLAKSWRGAFNMTYGATLGAHSIEHAVERAGIDPAEVEDVILGCALPEGTTGGNVARVGRAARRPAGHHHRRDRQPLLLVRAADHRDGRAAHHRGQGAGDGGRRRGVASPACRTRRTATCAPTRPCCEHKPAIYWTMLQTAETVAKRYNIPQRGAGRVRRAQPAARRGGAGGRQVQRRDRAHDHGDGRRRQGHRPPHHARR